MRIPFSGRLEIYLAAFFFCAYLVLRYLDFRDDPSLPLSSGVDTFLIPVVFGLLLPLRSLLALFLPRRDAGPHTLLSDSTRTTGSDERPFLASVDWPAGVIAAIVSGMNWFAWRNIWGATWESTPGPDLHIEISWLTAIATAGIVALLARLVYRKLFRRREAEGKFPLAAHTVNLRLRPPRP